MECIEILSAIISILYVCFLLNWNTLKLNWYNYLYHFIRINYQDSTTALYKKESRFNTMTLSCKLKNAVKSTTQTIFCSIVNT